MSAPIGGSTLSAGIADAQAQLQALIAPSGSAADLSQIEAAYQASGGGPILASLGFNPFQMLATGAFHTLYWSGVVIFLGITAVIAMQQSLLGRQTIRARHPLAALAQANFRLLAGSLLIANLPLVYALLVTVNGAVSEGVQAMGAEAAAPLLQTGSMATLSFAAARADAIRRAAARRAIALYPSGASRAEMVAIGGWYNAMALAVNAAGPPSPLPQIDATDWNDGQAPDDRVIAAIGRGVLQNFGPLVAALAALPTSAGSIAVALPSGGAANLAPLSAALASDDGQAAAAIAAANLPSNDGATESARAAYAQAVLTDTLAYLDGQILPTLGASPSLADRVKAWFSDRVERAAVAAEGFTVRLRDLVDWFGRAIGVVLTRLVAFAFTLGVRVLLEVNLFLLVLAVPFWLLPATEEAFYGTLRLLLWLSVVVPAYQFIMLFVDGLMGLVLKSIVFGPAAAGSLSASSALGGGATLVVSALAAVATGGETIALVTFGYLVTYVFLAIYVATKTPRLVALFLKGAGAAGGFLATFATGLIAGALTSVATAAVGGGGVASSLLGSPPPPAGSARAPAEGFASPPAPHRVRLGRLTASGPRSGQAGAGRLETARFGLRTFAEALGSSSPVDALHTARQAWERHEKARVKEEDARAKAEAKAEKETARTSTKRPPKK